MMNVGPTNSTVGGKAPIGLDEVRLSWHLMDRQRKIETVDVGRGGSATISAPRMNFLQRQYEYLWTE